MYTIKATDRVRGVIDLSCIRWQPKAGQATTVNEKDFMQRDVQDAIRMGFVSVVNRTKPTEAEVQAQNEENYSAPIENERVILCKNMSNNDLSFRLTQDDRFSMAGEEKKPLDMGFTVAPGATFTLTESQLSLGFIQAAIQKGTVQVIGPVESNANYTETSVDVSDVYEEFEQTDGQTELNVEAKSRELDVNEELTARPRRVEPSNVITDEDPDPVDSTAGESQTNPQTWNPAGDEQIKDTRKRKKSKVATDKPNVISDENPEPVDVDEGSETKVAAWTPSSEIKFVDEEQDLKKTEEAGLKKPKAEDLDFVDQKQEEERVIKLSKSKAKKHSEELDLL